MYKCAVSQCDKVYSFIKFGAHIMFCSKLILDGETSIIFLFCVDPVHSLETEN